METETQDINTRLAARLRGLRAENGLTLEALAERAGVSRSTISLIERGESSPTAAVLDRLAAGLGVTLASLFAEGARTDASPVSRRAEQVAWRDPATGYLRRNLSPPAFSSPIELAEIILPPGARVSYDTPGTRVVGISQQVWVIAGQIELSVGEVTHALDTGDCLAMRLEGPVAFRNPAKRDARYIVALAADQPAGGIAANYRGSTP